METAMHNLSADKAINISSADLYIFTENVSV